MGITLFGGVWIVILLISFYKGIKPLIYVLLFSMVLQCDNVIVLGENGIGPGIVTSVLFLIKCLFIKRKTQNVCLSYYYALGGLSLFIVYILFSDILRGNFYLHWLKIIQLFVYLTCSILLLKNSFRFSSLEIDRFIKNLSWFLLIIGFFQILITGRILPKLGIITELLYNDVGSHVYYHTPNIYWRILSTFLEPSYYSTLLVGLIFYIFYREKYIKHSYWLLAFMMIELVLTFSSTGYVVFAAFMVIYSLIVSKRFMVVRIMPIILLLGVVFLYFAPSILDDVIFNKMETSSGMERNKWNELAIDMFQKNMVYGIGYKGIRASSLIISIMAELGIIGLLLYLSFFVSQNIQLLNRTKIATINCESATRMMVACCMMGQIVACPDLELSTFWLTLYICSLCANK